MKQEKSHGVSAGLSGTRRWPGLLVMLVLLATPAIARLPVTVDMAKARLAWLVRQIRHHDNLYFNRHHVEISDAEYDRLRDQLTRLQACFSWLVVPVYALAPPPPQDQGRVLCQPMGSLKKSRDEQGVRQFFQNAGALTVLCQPKIDGIAIELVYEQGRLVAAATRGNGRQGLDILDSVRQIPALGKTLAIPGRVVLQGELFARLDRLKGKLQGYVSARHYVAGHISRKTPEPTALACLDFFPWLWPGAPVATDQEALNALARQGFTWPAQYTVVVRSVAQVSAWRERLQHNASDLPFLLDGIVLKLDSLAARTQRQASAWALAWKFPPAATLTRVVAIDFTVGRTGRVTPVLQVSPRLIGQRRLAAVSLGSVQTLVGHDIAVGDQISIRLEGQATPVFGQVLSRPAQRCRPVCPDSRRYSPGSCLSLTPHCEQQFLARLRWLGADRCLQLKPLTNPVLRQLVKQGALTSLADMFTLDARVLAGAGLKPRQVERLQQALKAARRLPFIRRLRAVGLPHVGERRLARLAQPGQDFAGLQALSADELARLAGVSQGQGLAIHAFLRQPEIQGLIRQLSAGDG